jgi:hypothetical protein
VFLSGGRSVGTQALQACALVLLTSCSTRQSPDASPAPDAMIGEATLLPPAAYLLALDSLLARAHPESHPTFVQGSIPITWGDLQSRHVRYREEFFVCPGEAALWFQPPEQRDNGTIELEVVQAFGDRGFAGSRVFVFRCTGSTCQLVRALPGSGDSVVSCGPRRS